LCLGPIGSSDQSAISHQPSLAFAASKIISPLIDNGVVQFQTSTRRDYLDPDPWPLQSSFYFFHILSFITLLPFFRLWVAILVRHPHFELPISFGFPTTHSFVRASSCHPPPITTGPARFK
jgi:hypothetical protein